jgi:hypothetical protein
MKRILITIVGFIAAMGFVAPAEASTGNLSQAEANSYCYVGMSCLANTQTQVENICNCTGDLVNIWTNSSGVSHKSVNYGNSYGRAKVSVNYKLTDSGFWRIDSLTWCDDEHCFYYFGV